MIGGIDAHEHSDAVKQGMTIVAQNDVSPTCIGDPIVERSAEDSICPRGHCDDIDATVGGCQ